MQPRRNWQTPSCKARKAGATTISRSRWRAACSRECWRKPPREEAAMQMNQPAPRNALDANRQGLMGAALDRVDGPDKVCGTAPYAYEVQEAPEPPLYGWIVEAAIGCGRVAAIDTREAERAPGVEHVMTNLNAPAQAGVRLAEKQRCDRPHPMLGDAVIPHYGQPVALIVAQTLEQARAASFLVKVDYDPMPGEYRMKEHLAQ